MREGLDRIAGFQDFQDEERGIALYPYFPYTFPNLFFFLQASESPCEEEMVELVNL